MPMARCNSMSVTLWQASCPPACLLTSRQPWCGLSASMSIVGMQMVGRAACGSGTCVARGYVGYLNKTPLTRSPMHSFFTGVFTTAHIYITIARSNSRY